jgi:hypothetical protein
MHNSDVLKLYPLVPTGTSVFISAVGPYRPLYVHTTTTEPTKKSGAGGEGG